MKNKKGMLFVLFPVLLAALAVLFVGCGGDGGGGGGTSYNVIFDMNGKGDDLPPTTVAAGGTIEKPEDPEADKYTFDYWYTGTDDTVEFDFDTAIVASMLSSDGNFYLHAKWTLNGTIGEDGYIVRFFVGDHDDAVNYPDQHVATGHYASKPVPDPERDGYTFNFWFLSTLTFQSEFDFENTQITAALADSEHIVLLEAKWEDDNAGPWLWMTFDDKKETDTKVPGGTPIGKSEISLKKEKNLTDKGDPDDVVYSVTGTIKAGFDYPFAGLIAEVNPGHEDYEANLAALRSATSFSFWISVPAGGGGSGTNTGYRVKVPQNNLKGVMELLDTSDPDSDYGTADASHYQSRVAVGTAGADPVQVTINLKSGTSNAITSLDLVYPSWGGFKDTAFDKTGITQINWQTNDFTAGTSFAFKIWGLTLNQE